jgi:anti-sigma regulatory factor (Ser/Thr protein kinase)
VLYNLLGNAIKYTPAGEVHLELYTLPADRRDGRVPLHIVVRDTGIGIPDDKQDYVFDKFTQVAASYSRKFGGSGRGLNIVRRRGQLMDGSIALASEGGRGTEVHITLWLRRTGGEETDRVVPDRELASARGARETILIVEDDSTNLTAAQRLLMKLGYATQVARNGEEALRVVEKADIDLILMDIQMPILDGVSATRIIRDPARFGPRPACPSWP